MISPGLLAILRCPWDPSRTTRLRLEEDHLVCERCALKFRIKGFPDLVVQEAELPPGCESLNDLPCQRSTPA